MQYQLRLNTQTLQITGVEAQVRREHPQKGDIPLATFVEIAEQYGLMSVLGTSYSNLYQLSHLPFNLLKIDKLLVDNIGKDSKSEAIVATIVQIVHALEHKAVAEGVEMHEQHILFSEKSAVIRCRVI